MTIKEATTYQLKQLKGKPLKQKLEHIITYFWLPILLTLALLIATVSFAVQLANRKDMGLAVICLNARPNTGATAQFLDDFSQYASIDKDTYQILLEDRLSVSGENSTGAYEANQMIMIRGTAKDLDIITGDVPSMKNYLYWEIFGDLREKLTPTQQEKYAPYFLYMDMAVLREMEASIDASPTLPDPTKPELMAEPVPVALLIPQGSRLTELYYAGAKAPICLGILGNTENLEQALAFLDYIME